MDNYEVIKYVMYGIVIIIGAMLFGIIYSYPSQYTCYKTKCIHYSLDDYKDCKFSQTRGGGLFTESYKEIYNCDGNQVQKVCLKEGYVNQNINATMGDILLHKCDKLEERN